MLYICMYTYIYIYIYTYAQAPPCMPVIIPTLADLAGGMARALDQEAVRES